MGKSSLGLNWFIADSAMEVFQSRSVVPWPKVFSPKVIIRDGQGCHDSLWQNAVLPSQREAQVCHNYSPASPLLLDLSPSTRHQSCRPSDENCSVSTGEEGCINSIQSICDRHHLKCGNHCTCRCQTSSDAQLFTKTSFTTPDHYKTSGCSEQNIAPGTGPHPCYGCMSVAPSSQTIFTSPTSVSCSETCLPQENLKSDIHYPNDLQEQAFCGCSYNAQPVSTTRTSIDSTGVVEVPRPACDCSARVPCLHHQPQPSHQHDHTDVNCQHCYQQDMSQTIRFGCRSSEQSCQKIRCVQENQPFAKKESNAGESDSVTTYPQCPCVSQSSDYQWTSRRNDRGHDQHSTANDSSCHCQNISIKEVMSHIQDKANANLNCLEHSTCSMKNTSPTYTVKNKVGQKHACTEETSQTESVQTEVVLHGVRYHGTWTMTKTRPADVELPPSVTSNDNDFGLYFLPDTPYCISHHEGKSVSKHCHCSAHGHSASEFSSSPQTAHCSSHQKNKRSHYQTKDNHISSRYSPSLYVQRAIDENEPYDLSTKSVKNKSDVQENADTSLSTVQHARWSPHEAKPVWTRTSSLGNTDNHEPAVYSPVTMLPSKSPFSVPSTMIPEYTWSPHETSAHGYDYTTGVDLMKPTTEQSLLESGHEGCQGYFHEQDAQHSTDTCVQRSERAQSVRQVEMWKSISPSQPTSSYCNSEILTNQPTKGQLCNPQQSSTAHFKIKRGLRPPENVQLTPPTHSTDPITTTQSGQQSHHSTVVMMAERDCTHSTVSGDAESSVSSHSAGNTLSPATYSTPLTVTSHSSMSGTPPLHHTASTHQRPHPTPQDASKQHVRPNSRKRRPRQRNFRCHLCSVTCSNRGQLKGHLRTHTGERPFLCQEPGCSKTFVRNEELTRHRRIHSGERPYACSHCGKTFMRKDHLNKHARVHAD